MALKIPHPQTIIALSSVDVTVSLQRLFKVVAVKVQDVRATKNLSTLFENRRSYCLKWKITNVKQRISFKLDSRLLLWRLYILIGAPFLCFCLIHLFGISTSILSLGDRMLVDMGNYFNCFTLCSYGAVCQYLTLHFRSISFIIHNTHWLHIYCWSYLRLIISQHICRQNALMRSLY